jgi:hypothetical protein
MKITSWQAERQGRYQGQPSVGDVVDGVVKGARDLIGGRLPKLPKVEPNKDAWQRWPEGHPIAVSSTWVDTMIAQATLPARDACRYEAREADKVSELEMSGSHVIIYVLDTTVRTRHRVTMSGGLVLVADAKGWRVSLVTP